MRALRSPVLLLRTGIASAAILLTAAAQWGPQPGLTGAADEWLRDRFIGWHASTAPEERILVVDIDESSLAQHPWPWRRERLADLIETLLAGGARGVALDILQEKAADAPGDARIAMLALHGPVVLAQLFDFVDRDQPLAAGQLAGGAPGSAAGAVRASGYIGNHAALAGAPHVGNIGVRPDSDGVLRRVPLYTWYAGRRYPTLSLALMNCCGGPVAMPSDTGDARVPYRRDWPAYTVARAADVLGQRVPANLMEGRLVLIGSSSLSVGDRIATPLGASSAGLLVHAAMLSELLDRQSGQAPQPWPGRWLALAWAAVTAVLAAFALPRLSAIANTALLAGSAALWFALALATAPHDPAFAPAAPLLSILLLLTVGIPFHWQLAQHKARRLLDTLRQYVAREVVDQLLRSDLKDPLAPRQSQVTTLIADMEGYTTQVESLAVEDAARLTTTFLDCLTRPVLEKGGTLDKYTGDGLVAFWGAPLPVADHADLALDAARQIVDEVRRLSARRVAAGYQPLRVRIGIESGLAMAGDYGTAFRSIYTAVGDSVNTASRLEQAARDFSHDIIIGEGTVERASRHAFQLLGERLLRGKERPSRLYTLQESA